MNESFFTLNELAWYLRVRKATVLKFIQTAGLPKESIGGVLIFRNSAIEEWLKGQMVRS